MNKRKHISKYTKEILEPAAKSVHSIAALIRVLGIKFSSGTHSYIKERLKTLGIDTSHFTGQAWNRNRRHPIRSVEQILRDGHIRRVQGATLRKALVQIGRSYECVSCDNNGTWNNEPLTLEVDHINGKWSDNRPENLQFICPNCHSQKTYKDGTARRIAESAKQIPKKIDILIENEPISEKQLVLRFSSKSKPKKPRQSAPDVNWRKLPKPNQRKVVRPSKEQLEILVWEAPILELARRFGITDNAVRRWCRDYGITNIPPLRYWPRIRAGWSHEAALEAIVPTTPPKRLTDQQVIEILALLKEDQLYCRAIGRKYNVPHSTISRIKHNKAYCHIPRT